MDFETNFTVWNIFDCKVLNNIDKALFWIDCIAILNSSLCEFWMLTRINHNYTWPNTAEIKTMNRLIL